MISALGAAFDLRVQERCAYLHRYLSDRVDPGEAGTGLYLRVRELERLRLQQRLLVPIGLRLVAAVR